MRVLLIISLLCTFLQTSAQGVEGEWKGYYTFDKGEFFVPNGKTLISIVIDSAGKVNSYTKSKNEFQKDTVVVRRMTFEKIGLNTIKLVELADDSLTYIDESMQTMILTLKRQNPPILSGKWESHIGVATYKGSVVLVRRARAKR